MKKSRTGSEKESDSSVKAIQKCPYAIANELGYAINKASYDKILKGDLAGMNEQEMQIYCEQQVDMLVSQLNENTAEKTTIAVTIVQNGNDASTRKAVITTSRKDGSLPNGADGNALNTNGMEVRTDGPKLMQRNHCDENGVSIKMTDKNGKVIKDKNGKPKPEKVYYDDNNGGKLYGNGKAFKKKENPEGLAEHHAEQRLQKSLKGDEKIAAMSHNRNECCPKCTKALGKDVEKVPQTRHLKAKKNQPGCKCSLCVT